MDAIFSAYSEGKDVPPSQVFQTEGFIQAACFLKIISLVEAQGLIKNSWNKILQIEFPVCEEELFYIPTAMQRAPVFPTTRD